MSLFTTFAASMLVILSAAFWSCLIMASQADLRLEQSYQEWLRQRANP